MSQIQKEADTLVKNHPFRVEALIGGTRYSFVSMPV